MRKNIFIVEIISNLVIIILLYLGKQIGNYSSNSFYGLIFAILISRIWLVALVFIANFFISLFVASKKILLGFIFSVLCSIFLLLLIEFPEISKWYQFVQPFNNNKKLEYIYNFIISETYIGPEYIIQYTDTNINIDSILKNLENKGYMFIFNNEGKIIYLPPYKNKDMFYKKLEQFGGETFEKGEYLDSYGITHFTKDYSEITLDVTQKGSFWVIQFSSRIK